MWMTEHSHPQQWAFPISWAEACTPDGNVCIILDGHRRELPSCCVVRTILFLLLYLKASSTCLPFLGSDMVVRIC